MGATKPNEYGEPLTMIARRAGRTTATVWNWITRGVVVGGAPVRLRATRLGRTHHVLPADYEAFLAATGIVARPAPKPKRGKPKGARRKPAPVDPLPPTPTSAAGERFARERAAALERLGGYELTKLKKK